MNSKLTGEGDDVKKNLIDIFNFKQRLLSLDMKTKVVQHVPRINLSHLNFLPHHHPCPYMRIHRAGSQLKKMSESQTKAGNQKKFENLKI